MAAATTSTAGTTQWQEPPRYKSDEDAIQKLWDAAGRGDWVAVASLCNQLKLGWLGHEMKRLAEVGKHYGALEKTVTLLENALNAHTNDGKFEAGTSTEVQNYLDLAVQSMRNEKKPVEQGILDTIAKLKGGKSISVSEAKDLQKFVLDSRALVVPKEYTSEMLSAQVKSARDQYERNLAGFKDESKTV